MLSKSQVFQSFMRLLFLFYLQIEAKRRSVNKLKDTKRDANALFSSKEIKRELIQPIYTTRSQGAWVESGTNWSVLKVVCISATHRNPKLFQNLNPNTPTKKQREPATCRTQFHSKWVRSIDPTASK